MPPQGGEPRGRGQTKGRESHAGAHSGLRPGHEEWALLLLEPQRQGSRPGTSEFFLRFLHLSISQLFPKHNTDMNVAMERKRTLPPGSRPPPNTHTHTALLNAPLPRPVSPQGSCLHGSPRPGPPSLAPTPPVRFSSPGLGLSGGVWLPEAGPKQIDPTQPWQAAARGGCPGRAGGVASGEWLGSVGGAGHVL